MADYVNDVTDLVFSSTQANAGLSTGNYLIPEDANVISHLWVHGGVITDTKSAGWVEVGSVPRVALYATNFPNAPAVEALGPFTDANYLKLGTGSDVLDFTGDFLMTFIVRSNPNGGIFYGNGVQFTSGHEVQISSTGIFQGIINYQAHSSNVITYTGQDNIVSFGRAGTLYMIKVNGETVYSATFGLPANSTAYPAYLGRYNNTGYAWNGYIAEACFRTTTPTTSFLDRLHEQIYSLGPGLRGTALTADTSSSVHRGSQAFATVPAKALTTNSSLERGAYAKLYTGAGRVLNLIHPVHTSYHRGARMGVKPTVIDNSIASSPKRRTTRINPGVNR